MLLESPRYFVPQLTCTRVERHQHWPFSSLLAGSWEFPMNGAWLAILSLQPQGEHASEATVPSWPPGPLAEAGTQGWHPGVAMTAHAHGCVYPKSPQPTLRLPSPALKLLYPVSTLQVPDNIISWRWSRGWGVGTSPGPTGLRGSLTPGDGPGYFWIPLYECALLGAVTHLLSLGVAEVLPPLFHLFRAVGTTSLSSQGSP